MEKKNGIYDRSASGFAFYPAGEENGLLINLLKMIWDKFLKFAKKTA